MSSPGNPPPSANNVFLTGFMGSGKSTVGPELARRLGWRFVDLDQEIEKDARKSVAELFAFKGEAAFRELEGRKLEALCGARHQVVALGGGAILRVESRAAVSRAGALVYLRATTDTLVSRLEPELGKRPLLSGVKTREELRARIEKLREKREALYEQSPIAIDADELSPADLALEIEARLKTGAKR